VSRRNPLGGTRVGKRGREIENAIAAEALADAKLPTLYQLESTLRSLTRNLADDPTDRNNPRSSAAAKIRFIADVEGRIERREYRRARGDSS
jgi:hypothetical protein